MLLAVHISDHVLAIPWLASGFALAAALVFLGARRLQDEEIPRIALLSAAFFITSLIHVRLPPTSVHLILNGLVGVLLGWRACLAIPVALLLQVVFIQHGGYTTLGVNTCVMAVPALAAYYAFHALRRFPWWRHPWFRSFLVALSAILWTQSLIYSMTLLWTTSAGDLTTIDLDAANAGLTSPWTWSVSFGVAALLVLVERRLETTPEFPLGLLIGELTVLITLGLNCAVLIHLPIAVIEGVVLGFAVGFLARVKPEMLGLRYPPESQANSSASVGGSQGDWSPAHKMGDNERIITNA
jgi:ABC-type Co2+ transport system permease subunit